MGIDRCKVEEKEEVKWVSLLMARACRAERKTSSIILSQSKGNLLSSRP